MLNNRMSFCPRSAQDTRFYGIQAFNTRPEVALYIPIKSYSKTVETSFDMYYIATYVDYTTHGYVTKIQSE